MHTIYNAAGESKELLDAVDVREYIASGRWFSQPPAVAAEPAAAAVSDHAPADPTVESATAEQPAAQPPAVAAEPAAAKAKRGKA
jgi:hypothetical protein